MKVIYQHLQSPDGMAIINLWLKAADITDALMNLIISLGMPHFILFLSKKEIKIYIYIYSEKIEESSTKRKTLLYLLLEILTKLI